MRIFQSFSNRVHMLPFYHRVNGTHDIFQLLQCFSQRAAMEVRRGFATTSRLIHICVYKKICERTSENMHPPEKERSNQWTQSSYQYNPGNYPVRSDPQMEPLRTSSPQRPPRPQQPPRMPRVQTLAMARTFKRWLVVASFATFASFSGLVAYHQINQNSTTSTKTASTTSTQKKSSSSILKQQGGTTIATATPTSTATATATATATKSTTSGSTTSSPVSGSSVS